MSDTHSFIGSNTLGGDFMNGRKLDVRYRQQKGISLRLFLFFRYRQLFSLDDEVTLSLSYAVYIFQLVLLARTLFCL